MIRRFRTWLGMVLLAAAVTVLPGCTRTVTVPGPAVEVKVPVPVACEIEQVPAAERPRAARGMSHYDLTKVALADRRVLMAENERLRAANSNPCPGEP